MAKAVQIERYKPDQLRFANDAPPDSDIVELRVVNTGTPAYAELLASIAAVGQVMPVIYQRVGDERYVIAGNHRLAALRELGRDVLAVDVAAVGDGTVDALEVALADQVIRSPLHPVDRFEAFSILHETMPVEDIARRFSLKEREVRQALAIAALAPPIRDAWRRGTITEKAAQAFTLEPDHKRQAKVFKALQDEGKAQDWEVRREIVGDRDAHGALLAFAGADAYRAKGGTVTEDLFGGRHAVSDPALLKAMADEKLDGECAALVAGGWGWAVHGAEAGDRYSWRRETVQQAKATKEEAARIKVINKREKELADLMDGDHDGDLDDEAEQLRDEAERIEDARAARAFAPELKAKCGCVVEVGRDGALEVTYGYVRSKAKAASDKTPAQRKKDGAKKADKGEVSGALEKDFGIWLKSATKIALQRNAALYAKSEHVLAACMAATLADLITLNQFSPALNDKQMILLRDNIAPPIMVQSCRDAFDPADYFARIPKANIAAAVKEAINADEAAKVERMGKAEAQAYAVENVAPAGWLPPQLRTEGYALLTPGAKVANAAPAKKATKPVKGKGSK